MTTYTANDLYDMFANQADPAAIAATSTASLALDIAELDTEAGITDYIAAAEAVKGIALQSLDGRHGTVDYHGDTLYLLGDAVVDNYGTDGLVRYYAKAIDAEGTEYRIAWDTTDKWDLACELDRLMAESNPNDEQVVRIEELSDMVLPDVSDESNACDWDWPVSVQRA